MFDLIHYMMHQRFLLDGLAFMPGLWTPQRTFCSVIAWTSLDYPKYIFVFPVNLYPVQIFLSKEQRCDSKTSENSI